MYVYQQTEPGLFTVGCYDPTGKWHPDQDYPNREAAAQRVAYLNGSHRADGEAVLRLALEAVERGLANDFDPAALRQMVRAALAIHRPT